MTRTIGSLLGPRGAAVPCLLAASMVAVAAPPPMPGPAPLAAPGAGADPEALAPAAVVGRLHEALLRAMKMGPDVNFEDRYRMLRPLITRSFAFPRIAKMILGSNWGGLDADQREQFLKTFTRHAVTTYVTRFNRYDRERFEAGSERAVRDDVRVVGAVFIDSDGKKRHFDYQVLRAGGHWRIVNVAVDGVSDLSLQRAQYTEYISDHGFAALIEDLQRRIRKMIADDARDAAS